MKFYIGASFKNSNLVNHISKHLIEKGHIHTYNWTNEIIEEETEELLKKFTELEMKGINDADTVIIILPAGRGSHVELGLALAYNKKVYLYSESGIEFDVKDTVNFYYAPNVKQIVASPDELINQVLKECECSKKKTRKITK